MKTDTRTPPYIDLTGRLTSLKSSLSPDCRLFEPAPEIFQTRRTQHDAPRWALRIGLVFLLTLAALAAAVLCQ